MPKAMSLGGSFARNCGQNRCHMLGCGGTAEGEEWCMDFACSISDSKILRDSRYQLVFLLEWEVSLKDQNTR